ncbi:hypothetical protein lerEdw1_002092 [Lerista edwardsae]|nr:hypothetical protein lerEdw1_002092 [Lerista edwardsae]
MSSILNLYYQAFGAVPDSEGKTCTADGATRAMLSDPSSPSCQALTSEETQQEHISATTNATSLGEEPHSEELREDSAKKTPASAAERDNAGLPASEENPKALLLSESTESPQNQTERNPAQLPSPPPSLPVPPPKTAAKVPKTAPGQAAPFQPSGQKVSDPHLRGQHSTPTSSPHLAAMHLPLPPSRVIEELHRALATKHRQDSFHGRENKGSPKKRVDVRPSRTSSVEHSREKDHSTSHSSDPENKRNSAKESDENKENLIMNSEIKEDSVFFQDEEVLNDSIISGTLPRKCKKELLAVKLRNRPSKQELEDRNIFPRRTDEERQEIRQQIEMKLSK